MCVCNIFCATCVTFLASRFSTLEVHNFIVCRLISKLFEILIIWRIIRFCIRNFKETSKNLKCHIYYIQHRSISILYVMLGTLMFLLPWIIYWLCNSHEWIKIIMWYEIRNELSRRRICKYVVLKVVENWALYEYMVGDFHGGL